MTAKGSGWYQRQIYARSCYSLTLRYDFMSLGLNEVTRDIFTLDTSLDGLHCQLPLCYRQIKIPPFHVLVLEALCIFEIEAPK